MSQAQADLEHLRTTSIEVVRKEPEPEKPAADADTKGKGKEKETDTPQSPPVTAAFPASASAFLNRLSSSTSQLQTNLQSTLQSTLASAQANPALSNPTQLRAQLAENFRLTSAKENLQLSMKQAEKLAEEYMKKGDQWVKDAEKWMGEAIKVVPPEEAERRAAGMSWDGSDWYSFSTSTSEKKDDLLSDAESKTPRSSMQMSGAALAGSRKEALLRRLREDKELLMVDPEGEGETQERKDEFRKWVEEEWPKAQKEEREKEEGNVGGVRMALVPEQLSDEQFWQRYLFHKHMIEAEEERRKALLQASQQAVQDDFSWDDDAEAEVPPLAQSTTTLQPAQPTEPIGESNTPKADSTERLPQPMLPPAPPSKAGTNTSTSTSPRDSEESYDLVSDQKRSAAPTEDDDSDWE